MSYLNLDIDYFTHPKVKRLVRLLGRGSEVLPLKLWAYAARYFQSDGRLTDLSAQEIEAECFWWGKPGSMIEKMIECGFVHESDGVYQIHEWDDHQGHLSAFKERAKAGAKVRWDKYRARKADASSNASSIASSNAPTLPTKPTKPTNQPTAKSCVRAGKKKTPQKDSAPPGFVAFWKLWPDHERKTDRKATLSRWNAAGLEEKADEILASVREYINSEQWWKDSGQFIPAPEVWLNKCRWEAHPKPRSGVQPADENGFQRRDLTDEEMAEIGMSPEEIEAVKAM